MSSLRRAASVLAVTAMVSGLALAAYAFFELRQVTPAQVEAVEIPVSPTPEATQTTKPAETVEPEPTETPTPEPTEVRILYPDPPKLNDRIGTITLPSLELSWPIFEGTEEEQLSKGVGHYVGSVLPGIQDNSFLSGHRTTVFNRLGELEENDLILIETSAGIFTYQVREFRIVDRSDQTVIGPRPTAVLTLTTCYPFNSLVRTTEAFIVEADLISSILTDE